MENSVVCYDSNVGKQIAVEQICDPFSGKLSSICLGIISSLSHRLYFKFSGDECIIISHKVESIFNDLLENPRVVTISSAYDKLLLFGRLYNILSGHDLLEKFSPFGASHSSYVTDYIKTSIDLTVDEINVVIDKYNTGVFRDMSVKPTTREKFLKRIEKELDRLLPKAIEVIEGVFQGGLKFEIVNQPKISNKLEQPKQSISYQLGEEVIEAELIENEVVEVKQVDSNIQTYTRNNKTYFNARNVWKQLGVKSSFSSWMKAKKRKALLENSIQTIEFRSGRNTRSVDWLIPIELLEQLKLTVKGK